MYHNRKANATTNKHERYKEKEYESVLVPNAFVI